MVRSSVRKGSAASARSFSSCAWGNSLRLMSSRSTSAVRARSPPGVVPGPGERGLEVLVVASGRTPRGPPRPTVPVAVSPSRRGFWSCDSQSPSAPKKMTIPAPQAAPVSCGWRPKNPLGAGVAAGSPFPCRRPSPDPSSPRPGPASRRRRRARAVRFPPARPPRSSGASRSGARGAAPGASPPGAGHRSCRSAGPGLGRPPRKKRSAPGDEPEREDDDAGDPVAPGHRRSSARTASR